MTDTTKPVELVAIVNDLMACDVGMITLPFGYGTVRKRIRQAITALDAANAEIERLTKERDHNRTAWSKVVDQCDVEYARADKAESESAALVAAAYADAQAMLERQMLRDDLTDYTKMVGLLAALKKRIPADATAALEAYGAAKVREGWEAGMKDAAKVEAFMPGSGKMKPMLKPWQEAILAAIKEKQP